MTLGFPYHCTSVPIIDLVQEGAGCHHISSRPIVHRGEMPNSGSFQHLQAAAFLSCSDVATMHSLGCFCSCPLPSAVMLADELSPRAVTANLPLPQPFSGGQRTVLHHKQPLSIPCCSSGLAGGSPSFWESRACVPGGAATAGLRRALRGELFPWHTATSTRTKECGVAAFRSMPFSPPCPTQTF